VSNKRTEMPSLDKLSNAGKTPDRAGLSKAGRALDKHGGRPGSAFPKAKGTPADKNAQGQFELDDILTSPNTSQYPNRLGGQDIFISNGRGARFDNNENFIGFLQPRNT
jgi:hypothetical protein